MKSSKKRPSLKKFKDQLDLPPAALDKLVFDDLSRRVIFDSMLRTLNEAFAADPDAMHAMICNRVPCNEALANHPTVQVQCIPRPGKTAFAVGLGGILSGLSEALTGRRIATKFSDPDPETGVSMVTGFCEFINKPKPAHEDQEDQEDEPRPKGKSHGRRGRRPARSPRA